MVDLLLLLCCCLKGEVVNIERVLSLYHTNPGDLSVVVMFHSCAGSLELHVANDKEPSEPASPPPLLPSELEFVVLTNANDAF